MSKTENNVSKIDGAISNIEKRFGKGSIISFSEESQFDIKRTPTGSFNLDVATGGGWPKGRIIEIYGPESSGKTTVALHAIAEVQKQGGIAAYIDAEHSFDPVYAENIGISLEKGRFLFSQPSSGEEAFSIAEELLKTNEVGIIVFDSVAAMVPLAEIDGDFGESKMGLHARLMSQAMRKLTGVISKSECCIIFINQLRDKIGVMFGCMHSSTKLHTTTGVELFCNVVNKKKQCSIISYDENSDSFVEVNINNHFKNGYADSALDFMKLRFESNNRAKCQSVIVTLDHKVLTQNGWKKAKELSVDNDFLISYVDNPLNKEQEQILIGSLLGDGKIIQRTNLSYYFNTISKKQDEYFSWKRKHLSHLFKQNGHSKRCLFLQKYFKDFYENRYSLTIKNKTKTNKYRAFTENYISKLDLISLMIWFLDDGHSNVSRGIKNNKEVPRKTGIAKICLKRLRHLNKIEQKYLLDLVVNRIKEIGYETYYSIKYNNVSIVFDLPEFKKFSKDIREFVVPQMQYKLLEDDRGFFKDITYSDFTPNKDKIFIGIKEICKISKKDSKCLGLYDIETDTSTYMIGSDKYTNGIVVHNSPETTTGGNALKFYASIRCDIRRKEIIKDKDNLATSNRVKVKVIKNKTFSPFKEAEFIINYGLGISTIDEIIDSAIDNKIIAQSGSWFSFGETKLGQGRPNLNVLMEDNPELFETIKQKLLCIYQ